jgi:hypothetical protein
MKQLRKTTGTAIAAAVASMLTGQATATEPCGDFGECKVLVEINSSDGDIGFHFLMDGDDLIRAALFNPGHRKIFSYATRRELRDQYLTEVFAESAEPLCFDPATDDDPDNDDEDFVTLTDFIERWDEGTYRFFGVGDDWELSYGAAELTFNLPAAPTDIEVEEEVDGDDLSLEISWAAGVDLGECSDGMEQLPVMPKDVPVQTWEVVVEPEVDGPLSNNTYVVRIPNNSADPEFELEVEVPDDYLETLPANTPLKFEIGAIGFDDNATFTEGEDLYCANETGDGCVDDE